MEALTPEGHAKERKEVNNYNKMFFKLSLSFTGKLILLPNNLRFAKLGSAPWTALMLHTGAASAQHVAHKEN